MKQTLTSAPDHVLIYAGSDSFRSKYNVRGVLMEYYKTPEDTTGLSQLAGS